MLSLCRPATEQYAVYILYMHVLAGPPLSMAFGIRDALSLFVGCLVLRFALTAGAQSFAVKVWVQTASISFTKTYAFINRSTAPGCGPELLHSTLLGTLQLVAGLSSRGQMGLAAELAGCCRWADSTFPFT